jgi:hypothetical protein
VTAEAAIGGTRFLALLRPGILCPQHFCTAFRTGRRPHDGVELRHVLGSRDAGLVLLHDVRCRRGGDFHDLADFCLGHFVGLEYRPSEVHFWIRGRLGDEVVNHFPQCRLAPPIRSYKDFFTVAWSANPVVVASSIIAAPTRCRFIVSALGDNIVESMADGLIVRPHPLRVKFRPRLRESAMRAALRHRERASRSPRTPDVKAGATTGYLPQQPQHDEDENHDE